MGFSLLHGSTDAIAVINCNLLNSQALKRLVLPVTSWQEGNLRTEIH